MFALPNTQLTRRLRREGRLREDYDVAMEGHGDQCTAGLNYEPLRPRADILTDYLTVIETTFAPAAYFGRVRKVAALLDSSHRRHKPSMKQMWKETKAFFKMAWKLGMPSATRGQFWRTFLGTLFRNPKSIRYIGSLCALYVHFGPFSRYVAGKIREQIAAGVAMPRVGPRPPSAAEATAPDPAVASPAN